MKQIINTNTYIVLFLSVVALLSTPLLASAETVLRGQETVTIAQDQEIGGNFYTLGTAVSVSGLVAGDWLSLAERITADGVYESDVLLLGRSIQLHGQVTEDARIVALDATIADSVGGDTLIIADTVKILSGADIAGDLVIFANTVEIEAPIGGSIMGRAGSMRVNGEIAGDIDVSVQELVLGERANISGNIVYASTQELVRAEEAVVGGEITYTYQTNNAGQNLQESITSLLMPLLAMLFAVLIMFLLVPQRMHNALERVHSRFGFFFLVGLGVFILTPFVTFAFLLSGLGSMVGILILLLYIFLILVGIVLVIPFSGYLFSRYVLKRDNFDVLSIAIGAVLLYATLLVPIVGFVWMLIVMTTFVGLAVVRISTLRK